MKISQKMFVLAGVLALQFAVIAQAETSHQAQVAFAEPADGAVVRSPFKVKFLVTGMAVKPAGEISAESGHHHLIINGQALKAGEAVPFDDAHQHFGKGQTETELKLVPGKYRLTLQFANGAHQSYGPTASKSINITVK